MCGDVRIVTGAHLGGDHIRAWRVVDGHTQRLTTEEARQILITHSSHPNGDQRGCGCISSYPRPPWHDAKDRGCAPVGEDDGHWDMVWHFRNEGIAGGQRSDPMQLRHIVEHVINWELAKLPNTFEGEDLQTAHDLLVRARANIEAVCALLDTGEGDLDYHERQRYLRPNLTP